MVKLVFLLRN